MRVSRAATRSVERLGVFLTTDNSLGLHHTRSSRPRQRPETHLAVWSGRRNPSQWLRARCLAAGLILPSILVNSPSPYRPVVRGSSSKAASSNVLMTTRRGIEDFKRHSGSRAPQGPRGTTRHSASLSAVHGMLSIGSTSTWMLPAHRARKSVRQNGLSFHGRDAVQSSQCRYLSREYWTPPLPVVANGIVGHSAPTVRTTYPSRRRHQHESRRPLSCGGVVEPSSRPRGPSQAVNENRNPSFPQWRASVSASQSSTALPDTLVSLRRRPMKHSHALDFGVSVAWPRAVCLL